MLIANDRAKAEFNEASKHLGRNTRTARVVAKIFSKFFFVPVRGGVAGLNRYLRNGEFPFKYLHHLMRTRAATQAPFLYLGRGAQYGKHLREDKNPTSAMRYSSRIQK